MLAEGGGRGERRYRTTRVPDMQAGSGTVKWPPSQSKLGDVSPTWPHRPFTNTALVSKVRTLAAMVARVGSSSVRMRSMHPPHITGRLPPRPPLRPPLPVSACVSGAWSVRRWSGSALCGGRGHHGLTPVVSSSRSLTVRWCTGEAGADPSREPVSVQPWELPRRLEGFLQRTVSTQQVQVRVLIVSRPPTPVKWAHPTPCLSPLAANPKPQIRMRMHPRMSVDITCGDAGGGCGSCRAGWRCAR